MPTRRWLFAEQLGPHYLDSPDQPVLLIEAIDVLRRRRFHRQKAHLVLSALRHRAAELGQQVVYLRRESFADAVREFGEPLEIPEPTSRVGEESVRGLPDVTVVRNKGWATHRDEFASWAGHRKGKRLLLEDFYRDVRRRHGLLMDGTGPAGGHWNYDHENREPPPKQARLDVPPPWRPVEDDIDEQVRADLDALERDGVAFVGNDGPRGYAATRTEALAALDHFVEARLPTFGKWEDAMLAGDRTMSHSLLSPALNLGLLHPLEVVRTAEAAFRRGDAPIQSVEGFVRQVIGWREYIWGMYWHGGADYRASNALGHREAVPEGFWDLDADGEVDANCLSDVLRGLREDGWLHHIPRLMVLANYALQRGWDPDELTDWFHQSFVDGFEWVMTANVIGMSQHADGGLLATKPYASGGAYINRMSDYCGSCRYDPKVRVGENACPFTAGYWWFIDRHADLFAQNQRMRRAAQGRLRLQDLDELVEQEVARGNAAP